MDYLWNNWWQVMDFLAVERVENSLAVFAGWLVFCFCLVTLWFPLSLLVRFVPATRVVVITAIVTFSVLMSAITAFQAHSVLNDYQQWYTRPSGPPLDLSG
jgi:hypothetical protein